MRRKSTQLSQGASIGAPPARGAPNSVESGHAEAAAPPLDELMLAMDVVDTLRHEQRLVDAELSAEGRDRRLIERLRAIYASQGIDVADEVLAQGVGALREDRFTYRAPTPGLGRSLQVAYVSRARWVKYLLIAAAVIAAALVALT